MKEIPLTQGKVAIVDDEDFEIFKQYKWHYAAGYARRNKRLENGSRKIEFMHRLIAKTPEGLIADHINGNTLDNRKVNLRNVTSAQNARNARKKSKAKSKYKGVTFFKRKKDVIGKWVSVIQVDGKSVKLGYFNSEVKAAEAYNEAAIKYHGEYAVINEVDKMDINHYQNKASRTIPKEKWFRTNLTNFSMGLSGETGELVDHFKKHLFHGHEMDMEEVKKEIGDVLWYLSSIATILKIDLSEVANLNIRKLEERYPNGFLEEDSLKRVEYEINKQRQRDGY